MTTIKLKNGSGAPTAGDLAQGEPALDLTNKRLYTEDSGGTVIEVGTNPGTDVTFADNRKAIFGAGSDLQIYHDGSASYIADTGTGTLNIKASGSIRLRGNDTDELLARFNENGSNQFYYDSAEKLATTSTGIDVTGTVTADGLTVDGNGTIQSNASSSVPTLTLKDTDTTISVGQSLGRLSFSSADNSPDAAGERAYIKGLLEGGGTAYGLELGAMVSGSSPAKRLSVSGSGDISFYEDTGTTAKLFWDASAERLGIGTTSPSGLAHLSQAGGADTMLVFENTSGTNPFQIGQGNDDSLRFYYNASEKMRITSAGNVGIGTSSPSSILTAVSGASADETVLTIANDYSTADAAGHASGLMFQLYRSYASSLNDAAFIKAEKEQAWDASGDRDSALTFGTRSGGTEPTERMRIDSSGNLLVGRTLAGSGTGFEANTAFGSYILSTSTSIAGVFDRLSTDGEIVQFRKDGVAVGSIGTNSSRLTIGNGDTGLLIAGDLDNITPFNVSTNASRDAAVDLGNSGVRFKDLYLSGRVVADGVTTSAHAWSSQSDSTSSSAHLYFRNPNGFVGNISTSGTATAYNTSSDYRLKENVVAMSGATERLKQLAPKRFNFIADADTTVDGFLAHEVADVVPEAVTGAKDAVDDDGNAVYQGIDQSKLVPLLVATIQELEARIAALESN